MAFEQEHFGSPSPILGDGFATTGRDSNWLFGIVATPITTNHPRDIEIGRTYES